MTIRARSVAALFAIAFTTVAGAGEHRIDAFAPLIVVGEHKVVDEDGIAKIAGTVQGPLYVETDGRQIEDGIVSCRFVLTVDSDTLEENGSGTCRITYPDGAEIRADTSCTGTVGSGCAGEFRVTDGTGRLTGARGVGEVRFETRQRVYRLLDDGRLDEIIFGVAFWDDYIVRLPD